MSATPAHPSGPLHRILVAIEQRRLPILVSLLASASLAAFTGIRFLVLVRALPPDAYGVFNIYTLLASLLPLFMSLGLTLQFQRVAHLNGRPVIKSLLTWSATITAVTVLPSFVIVFLVTAPLEGATDVLLVAFLLAVIGASTALTTFHSQIMLGLNHRSAASLLMFLTNASSTTALLPAAVVTGISPVALLGWWALWSTAVSVFSAWIARSQRGESPASSANVSIGEGLLSLPSQIGPWLFIFVIRLMIGVNIDEAAIANYAIAATIADMAFLVAVSLLNYFTNRVMVGSQSPWRGIFFSAPVYLVLSVVGIAAIAWFLPIFAQDGYVLEPFVAIILTAVGLVRMYITAWRSRALGQKKVHVSSGAYLAVIIATVATLWVLAPSQAWIYAAATLVGFVIVAAVQRFGLRQSPGKA